MTRDLLGSKLLTFPTPLLPLLLFLSFKQGAFRKPWKGLLIIVIVFMHINFFREQTTLIIFIRRLQS